MITTIAVLGALTIINLVLTAGIIRRLRDISASGGGSSQVSTLPDVVLSRGEQPASFEVQDACGETITEQIFKGEKTLLGVIAQGCSLCAERLPDYVEVAKKSGARGEQVITLVIADADYAETVSKTVGPSSRFIIESAPDGPFARALKLSGYPAFARFNEAGVMLRSGVKISEVA